MGKSIIEAHDTRSLDSTVTHALGLYVVNQMLAASVTSSKRILGPLLRCDTALQTVGSSEGLPTALPTSKAACLLNPGQAAHAELMISMLVKCQHCKI